MKRIVIALTVLMIAYTANFAQERAERGDRDRRDPTQQREPSQEPKIDWDAKCEAYLEENPGVAKAVKSGKITKEKVIAGMKARMEESTPSEEEQLEALYQKMLKDNPDLKTRVTKEQLMPRLKVMLAQQRSRQDGNSHVGSELRGKYAFKRRWTEEEFTRAEAELTKQAEAGGVQKKVAKAIEQTLIKIQIEGERFVVDPKVSADLKELGLTDEQITLVVGLAQKAWVETVDQNMGVCLQEYDRIVAGAKQQSDKLDPRLTAALDFSMDAGNRMLRNRFAEVVKEGVMTRAEADALLQKAKVVDLVDWDARYEQFLKVNPNIKARVDSGEWTKEQVLQLLQRRNAIVPQARAEANPERDRDRRARVDAGIERADAGRSDQKPGTVKWKLPLGGNVGFCSPAIGKDGTLYIGAGQQKLYALKPDGTEKWSVAASGWVMGAPAVGEDGTIYLGTYSEEKNSHIHAFTGAGQERWSYPVPDTIPWSSPAIAADGTVYVGSDDNHLYALNPDGSEKWRFETGEVDDFDCSPAIGEDGTIYFASKDGNLYALYGESGGLAETPWPMHARDPRHTGRVHPASHQGKGRGR